MICETGVLFQSPPAEVSAGAWLTCAGLAREGTGGAGTCEPTWAGKVELASAARALVGAGTCRLVDKMDWMLADARSPGG